MTLRRRLLAAATYALTRRCLNRRFYLKPSPALNQIHLYALAHAQQKHDVEIHAFVAMRNRLHENVTVPHGVLPDFMRDLRREIALGAKQLYQLPQNVRSAEKPTLVGVWSSLSAAPEHVSGVLRHLVAWRNRPRGRDSGLVSAMKSPERSATSVERDHVLDRSTEPVPERVEPLA